MTYLRSRDYVQIDPSRSNSITDTSYGLGANSALGLFMKHQGATSCHQRAGNVRQGAQVGITVQLYTIIVPLTDLSCTVQRLTAKGYSVQVSLLTRYYKTL